MHEQIKTHAEMMTVGPYKRPTRDIGGLGLSLSGYRFPLITESDAQFDAYEGYPDIQADFVFKPATSSVLPIKRSRIAC